MFKIKKTKSEIRASKAYNKWRGINKKKKKSKKKTLKKIKPDDYLQVEANKLRGKPYSVFLKSAYWVVIRAKILTRDNRQCTNCKSKINLQVHHSTYKHHFMEHKYLSDLHTLCEKCHYDIHCIKDIK